MGGKQFLYLEIMFLKCYLMCLGLWCYFCASKLDIYLQVWAVTAFFGYWEWACNIHILA